METKFNVFEANLDVLGLFILDEKEAVETEAGEHLEYRNGEYVWVVD